MLTETIPVAPIQEVVDQTAQRENQAKSIIKKYTLLSGGAALVPYDFVDVISSTVAQTMMIKELCTLYNVSFSEKWINVAGWSAAGSAIIKAVSNIVESVISGSGFQSSSFDLSGAAIAAIYTGTVGEFYHLHLKNGGTLQNIKIEDFVDYFIQEIKQGDISLATFTNPKTLINHLNIV